MRKIPLLILMLVVCHFGCKTVEPQPENPSYGGRGCCSHHGGVCGCNARGEVVCCDNTVSKSCEC